MMKSCPFCMQTGKKVNAHIIPKAFFDAISMNGSVLRQRELGQHPKKMHIGVYDDKIWCQSCEVKYGRWDDKAIAILRKPIEEFSKLSNEYELKLDCSNDLNDLRLFFISLIWRASESKKKFYDKISLGEFSNRAREIMRSNSPGSIEDFSTIISFSGKDDGIIIQPVRVRHSGVWFYRFHFGRFIADIKVSSQPTPKELLPAVIGCDEFLVILSISRDIKTVQSVAKIARQLTNHSAKPAQNRAKR